MSIITLKQAIEETHGTWALTGFVCLGYEEAKAYIRAAEEEDTAAILMVGPGARESMPIAIWGAMLSAMAEDASVPLVIHLDHGRDREECEEAIAAGFSSVMFDGSRLSLNENIALTRDIVSLAHENGVSCEGEIGFVGYDAGEESQGTDPQDAQRFAKETGVDAMAISVGNTHLQKSAEANLNIERIAEIHRLTPTPLVIHGGSGVPHAVRAQLATSGMVAKFNIGTELRQVFGQALRDSIAQCNSFDRLSIMSLIDAPLAEAARGVIRNLKGEA